MRTLRSGVYVTAIGRELGIAAPLIKAGRYRTANRPGHATCALRGTDKYGTTTGNVILIKARSWTVRLPADTAVVEVAGPCTWRRV